MSGTYLIEVSYKPGVRDPLGEGVAQDVDALKLARVTSVSSAQLYRIVGTLAPADRERIARDLLCDPVVQTYTDGVTRPTRQAIVVDVWFKPGVTDVVGESVLKGIRDLNFEGVLDVRTGHRYRFVGLSRVAEAEQLALALLVNPLIHEPRIYAH